MDAILVTGGAGFIGTNFLRHQLSAGNKYRFINLDALTYAGNPANLADLEKSQQGRYRFVQGDIGDEQLVEQILTDEQCVGLIHFAAESHVDRSIHGPLSFIETNVVGTSKLLMAATKVWKNGGAAADFRFLHVSTDEVYGSLGAEGYFKETTPYDPSSPYSASKAGSDHLVKAWHRTYGLPTIVSNCSNNYGPYQFPEKLIPLMILNIIESKPLPIYGDGSNIRDWLYVTDHCDALATIFKNGVPGETYNIGGGAERKNIEVVNTLCAILDDRLGRGNDNASHKLIQFVTDRPGHDQRYAIDSSKIRNELGWEPKNSFETALEKTVDWYLQNGEWVDYVRSGEYREWIKANYQKR